LDHAVVIDRATRELDDPDRVRVVDEALAGACPWASPHDLSGLAERIRAATAPEAAADKAARQRAGQKLSLSKSLDGMWRVDAVRREALVDRVEVRDLRRSSVAAGLRS
jgi:hypothetical protein